MSIACKLGVDLTGQQFGFLTAVRYTGEKSNSGNRLWELRCICGNTTRLDTSELRKRSSPSCGCRAGVRDLRGLKFGRLTVQDFVGFDKKHNAVWTVRCDCGKELKANAYAMRSGNTKSCGCLRADTIGALNRIPEARRHEANLDELLRCYQRGAAKRGLVFELTNAQFQALVSSECQYCGVAANEAPLRMRKTRHIVGLNGVDRVDNAIGYTVENSVPCCTWCNTSKAQLSTEQFFAKIRTVYERHCI